MNPSWRIDVQLAGRQGDFKLDAAFSCPMQGITALFGASGCGKTTLLRSIAGLQRMQGRVCIGDEVWQDDSRGVFMPVHRRPIGYVFQEASLFAHLTVQQNLEYGMTRIAPSQRKVSLADALHLLGISDLLTRRPHQLSGGQRQRVGMARALLTSPQLLLMDEPLASLDRQSKLDILPYLERLHDELAMPVLYVSHAPDEVARLADHLVLLEAGRVQASGPLMELHARLDLAVGLGGDADSIIEAQVAGHDDAFALSYLDFAGGRFSVSRNALPVGHAARLRVMASDVSLTLEHQRGTSILNIFPARVDSLIDANPSQMLVRLDVAGAPLLARITRKSAQHLGLAPGARVYAQIKSVALVS